MSLTATQIKTVAVLETQPITVEGLRAVLTPCPDLQLTGAALSLLNGLEMLRDHPPSVVIIDKAFGVSPVMETVSKIRNSGRGTAAIVWGVSMSDAEALRLVQGGAQGVIRKTADVNSLLTCIRSVANGNTWMEDSIFHQEERSPRYSRSNLTSREQQVVDLVEQGMKNKEIARSLGIRPGTVKIHLKHIFEKTGVRGRYGLALSGLREKGLLSLPTV